MNFVFIAIPRPRRRLTELMVKTALEASNERDGKRWSNAQREWIPTFFRSPMEFLPDKSGERVGCIRMNVTRLEVICLL